MQQEPSSTPARPARSRSTGRARMRLLAALAVCAVGLVAALAAVTASGHVDRAAAHSGTARTPAAHAAASKTVNISLAGFMFSPMKVTIKAGTSVTWHWPKQTGGASVEVVHNVTSLAKKGSLRFKGSRTQANGTYTVKFTKPGTYYYECSIHPLSMQGEIIVTK